MTHKERAERYARILYLRRLGWQLTEIGNAVGLSRVRINGILREARAVGDLPTHKRLKVPEEQSMLRANDLVSNMTVREDLAKAAMTGLIAAGAQMPELIADKAYRIADAMIARANGATNGATPSRIKEEAARP